MAKDQRLSAAIAELNAMDDKHKIKMQGGKLYAQVKDRQAIMRKHFGTDASVITTPVEITDEVVRFQAVISLDGTAVASGYSEEIRGTTPINRKAAVEKAETSAIGRALANIGLMGGEYASANELDPEDIAKAQAAPAELSPRQHLEAVYKRLPGKKLTKEKMGEINKAFALINKAFEEAEA